MNNFITFLDKKFRPLAEKLGNQPHLKALQQTMMKLGPLSFAGSLGVIGTLLFKEGDLYLLSLAIVKGTFGLISLYVALGLSYELAKDYDLEPLMPMFLSAMGLLVSNIQALEYLDGRGLLPAILISIITVETYRLLKKIEIKKPEVLSQNVKNLLGETLIVLCFGLLYLFLYKAGKTLNEAYWSLCSMSVYVSDSLFMCCLITILTHLIGFCGIHDIAISGISAPLREGNLSINALTKAQGGVPGLVFTTPFWVYFVIIGGVGNILSLALLLCFSKEKRLKDVGKTALVPALFNISEPLMFGLPVMMEPLMLLPFVGTSLCNCIITYLCMNKGLVNKAFALLSWNMPSFIGAYLATLDLRAVILVIGLLMLDMLIYYPFVRAYEKRESNK